MKKNYQKNVIPDPAKMIQNSERILKKLRELPRISFDQMLSYSSIGKWNINKSVFNEYLGLHFADQKGDKKIKGLYVFFDRKSSPVYVGISRDLVQRLKNHFTGKTHNSATLVYLIGKYTQEENGKMYTGRRADFPMHSLHHVYTEIKQWKIAFVPIDDDYELHFAEIYIACELKTFWNSFATH